MSFLNRHPQTFEADFKIITPQGTITYNSGSGTSAQVAKWIANFIQKSGLSSVKGYPNGPTDKEVSRPRDNHTLTTCVWTLDKAPDFTL